MTTDKPVAVTKPRFALLALLLVLLILGVAAGVSATWYGLVPTSVMEILRPLLRGAPFMPIIAVALVLFHRRRQERKRRMQSR